MTNIIDDLEWRYATKVFDPSKKISEKDFNILLQSLRLTPTSINSQSSRYFIASSEEAIKKVAESTKEESFLYNTDKILHASHSIVFTSKVDYSDNDLKKLLELEQNNQRLPEGSLDEVIAKYKSVIHNHKHDLNDIEHWLSKQSHIALGVLLSAAASLRIDSIVIGGFNVDSLNKSLGLNEKGLCANFIVSLGYRSQDDYNSPDKNKKARFDDDELFHNI